MTLFEVDAGPGDPQRELLSTWEPRMEGKAGVSCPDLTVVSLWSMHMILPIFDPNLQSLQVLQLHFRTFLWLQSAVCAS